MIVVYLPNGYELLNNKTRTNKLVINILNNLNIENINVFEEFKKENFSTFFDIYRGHYNSKGYNYLSKIIDKYLKKNTFDKN